MKKFIIAVLALFMATNLCLAATKWMELAPKTYVDLNSVRKTYDGYEFYIKQLSGAPMAADYLKQKNFWYEINLIRLKCAEETVVYVTNYYFDLKGRMVETYRANEYHKLLPDTLGQKIYLDGLCKVFNDHDFPEKSY